MNQQGHAPPDGPEWLIRPHLAALKPYNPIVPPELLEEETSVPSSGIIKLDGNENPYGPSPRVHEALARLATPHLYPDSESIRLRRALGDYVGVDPEHLIVGAGSDELIDLLLRLCLEPGDRVVNCVPTFGMYQFSTTVCGGTIVNVPREPSTFAIDVPKVRVAIDQRTKVLFVASPNNPTGNITPMDDILALLQLGPLVVVDEAYYEFCGQTVAPEVPKRTNLVVLRTFSKWAGLAGLRVGYGVFPGWLTAYLMRMKPPYNVNVVAQAAGVESLKDLAYLRANIDAILQERERLSQKLSGLPFLKAYPSQANFILCAVLKGSASELHSQLRERGILVRYFDTPLLRSFLRISVGKPEHTDALVQALRELAP